MMNNYKKSSELHISFKPAIKMAFKHCWTYTGRSSRAEYWWFLVYCLLSMFFLIFGLRFIFLILPPEYSGLDDSIAVTFAVLFGIVVSVNFMPYMGVLIRRLHDIGKSAWNLFYLLLPVVGWIVLLIMTLKETEPCLNEYGGVKGHTFPPKLTPLMNQQSVSRPPVVFQPPRIDVSGELSKYATLHQQGVITKEEFESIKAKLLSSVR